MNSHPKCLQQHFWARLKLPAQHSTLTSHMSGWEPSTWAVTYWFPRCTLARGWIRSGAGTQAQALGSEACVCQSVFLPLSQIPVSVCCKHLQTNSIKHLNCVLCMVLFLHILLLFYISELSDWSTSLSGALAEFYILSTRLTSKYITTKSLQTFCESKFWELRWCRLLSSSVHMEVLRGPGKMQILLLWILLYPWEMGDSAILPRLNDQGPGRLHFEKQGVSNWLTNLINICF